MLSEAERGASVPPGQPGRDRPPLRPELPTGTARVRISSVKPPIHRAAMPNPRTRPDVWSGCAVERPTAAPEDTAAHAIDALPGAGSTGGRKRQGSR